MARKKSETMPEELQPVETSVAEQADHIPDPGKMVEQEPETAEPVKAPEPAKETGPVIYAGPTLPGSVLVRYTTFRDGQLRPHIKQLIEQCSAVGKMIVPVSKLAETERKLQDSSSIEAGRFAEILKHFRKGA